MYQNNLLCIIIVSVYWNIFVIERWSKVNKITVDDGTFPSSRYYYIVDIEVFIDCQAIFPKFIYAWRIIVYFDVGVNAQSVILEI